MPTSQIHIMYYKPYKRGNLVEVRISKDHEQIYYDIVQGAYIHFGGDLVKDSCKALFDRPVCRRFKNNSLAFDWFNDEDPDANYDKQVKVSAAIAKKLWEMGWTFLGCTGTENGQHWRWEIKE
uniref:Uncharacterized protein n=1 Tax=Ciona savignyi TaxID=51511 RepID=H2Z5I4_CIOSA